jgi:hypothetical protein
MAVEASGINQLLKTTEFYSPTVLETRTGKSGAGNLPYRLHKILPWPFWWWLGDLTTP